MKFKFLTLSLLVLVLNCNSAEHNISVCDPRLLANPKFVNLNNEIQFLKQDVSKLEIELNNIKQSHIFVGNQEIAIESKEEIETELANVIAKLIQKRKERKELAISIIKSTENS